MLLQYNHLSQASPIAKFFVTNFLTYLNHKNWVGEVTSRRGVNSKGARRHLRGSGMGGSLSTEPLSLLVNHKWNYRSDRSSAKFQVPLSGSYSSTLKHQLSIWHWMLLLIMHYSPWATSRTFVFSAVTNQLSSVNKKIRPRRNVNSLALLSPSHSAGHLRSSLARCPRQLTSWLAPILNDHFQHRIFCFEGIGQLNTLKHIILL